MWSEKSFLSLVQESFGCKQHGTTTYRLQVYMGKSCLKLDHQLHVHKQVLWNINESPWLMIPNQQHWSVPRHVTLWHKMLVILPATFPLSVLAISEEYSGSLEADMSENHPSCSSVKWEVLPLSCPRVFWMQAARHSHVQVASIYGKVLFETGSSAARSQASTGEQSWITLA